MNIVPSNNPTLIGYNEIFLNLKNLYDKNLLPNKIIFSGSSGIGKSTFAYHLSNYFLSKDEERGFICFLHFFKRSHHTSDIKNSNRRSWS